MKLSWKCFIWLFNGRIGNAEQPEAYLARCTPENYRWYLRVWLLAVLWPGASIALGPEMQLVFDFRRVYLCIHTPERWCKKFATYAVILNGSTCQKIVISKVTTPSWSLKSGLPCLHIVSNKCWSILLHEPVYFTWYWHMQLARTKRRWQTLRMWWFFLPKLNSDCGFVSVCPGNSLTWKDPLKPFLRSTLFLQSDIDANGDVPK